MVSETSKVGKRGTVVIPAAVRRQFGIEEGSYVTVEPGEGVIVIRPAVVLPVEVYSAERRAELLLSNAVNETDYKQACEEVRRLGLDPDAIPHVRPEGA